MMRKNERNAYEVDAAGDSGTGTSRGGAKLRREAEIRTVAPEFDAVDGGDTAGPRPSRSPAKVAFDNNGPPSRAQTG